MFLIDHSNKARLSTMDFGVPVLPDVYKVNALQPCCHAAIVFSTNAFSLKSGSYDARKCVKFWLFSFKSIYLSVLRCSNCPLFKDRIVSKVINR